MGSMLKLQGTELQQALSEFLVESLGDHGAVAYPVTGEPGISTNSTPDMVRGIVDEMFYRRAATIYGGSSEIQRGIIAKMLFQF